MVRKPGGTLEYFLAGKDVCGSPMIPFGWTVVRVMHWTEDDETFLGDYSASDGSWGSRASS